MARTPEEIADMLVAMYIDPERQDGEPYSLEIPAVRAWVADDQSRIETSSWNRIKEGCLERGFYLVVDSVYDRIALFDVRYPSPAVRGLTKSYLYKRFNKFGPWGRAN